MNPQNHAQTELMIAGVAGTAVSTANLDTNGKASWATLTITLSPGLTTDAVSPTFSLLESDDTVVSNFATITADKTLAVTSTSATNSAVQVYEVDLRGRKRYLRLSLTPGTVATDDAIAASAVARFSHLRIGPATTTDMVVSTNYSVVVV